MHDDADNDDVMQEWAAAFDGRYGTVGSAGSSISTLDLPQRMRGDRIVNVYMNEQNKRVIAECESGTKRALGYFDVIISFQSFHFRLSLP